MFIISSIYFTAVRYVSKATRAGIKLTNNKMELTMLLNNKNSNRPTSSYVFATWGALAIGVLGYLVGLWNASVELNEKHPPFGGSKEEYHNYFDPLFNFVHFGNSYNSIQPRSGRELFLLAEKK